MQTPASHEAGAVNAAAICNSARGPDGKRAGRYADIIRLIIVGLQVPLLSGSLVGLDGFYNL